MSTSYDVTTYTAITQFIVIFIGCKCLNCFLGLLSSLNLSHTFGSPFISGISGNKSQIEPYSTSDKHLGVNIIYHIECLKHDEKAKAVPESPYRLLPSTLEQKSKGVHNTSRPVVGRRIWRYINLNYAHAYVL